ncbi:hypothetical protein IFM89_002297 [Coptis chinensis]|uniref:Uncharacterized protein n=1 Tax=Coptis chinensis TaxID=261450 RepID=A0A835ILT0_9MAGN|nr:hypothetical protein IFM89_002297 [Coptis chinensis]
MPLLNLKAWASRNGVFRVVAPCYLLKKVNLYKYVDNEEYDILVNALRQIDQNIVSASKITTPQVGAFDNETSGRQRRDFHVESTTKAESEPFVVPGLPDRVELTKAYLPARLSDPSSDLQDIHNQIREAEETAYDVVVNSFNSLDPKYVEAYQKIKGNKAWCIGPVSLCNKEDIDKAERGNRMSIDDRELSKWLDSKEPNSVVYVCHLNEPDQPPKLPEAYQKIKGNKAWCIGPVCLCNKEDIDKAERGNRMSIDDRELSKWLDSKEPNSVVYVCRLNEPVHLGA